MVPVAAAANVSETAPNAPNRTFFIERFMARHISTERMNPENPSSVPAMMRTLLPSTKPVAAAASPAYELRSDITTGMSAAPIGITSSTPKQKPSVIMM